MAIVAGLHGRARMRRAALSRIWLLALLILVLLGLRALEADAWFFVRFQTANHLADTAERWVYALSKVVACASYIVAGMTFDRIGIKRGIAIVILVWCAVMPMATVVDPVAFRVLSSPLRMMLPGFLITGYLLALRLAWPLRRRGVAVVLLLLLYEQSREHPLLRFRFPLVNRDIPETWQFPILALTTLGAALFIVWLAGLREVDAETGLDLRPPPQRHEAWADVLSSRALWIILAFELCRVVTDRVASGLRWEQQSLGGDVPTFLLAYASTIATLTAAWASDRIFRQRRDWVFARRPFLVAGFAVAAVVPVLAALGTQSGPALHIIALADLGVLSILTLVLLDCVPRRAAGRVIGFVLSAESVFDLYCASPLEHAAARIHGIAALVAVFAAAGAVLSARLLPRLQPVDP
ncbi:membrane protein of unknown function [Beijerinckiaceae bacterium RH AL1]|nr:hypothetical protein [Beijerinckiaceae bacterium]VVB49759.1 membrane protein of unknown function [Beijerinckiaceae bacterium RH CH11]VVB49836.1 membrane protein of unknown function [Beijerinckiaceae bacterium RH AL8]VVC57062.1 membrane protein of unknown function [Beijerinckiaceae bacterium RH AL1]